MSSPHDKQKDLARLQECGVVAVIKGESAEQAVDMASSAAAGGIVGIEIRMPTADALKAIEQCVTKLGERAVVGAGSVMNARVAKEAIESGARFIVSPNYDPQTFIVSNRSGVLAIPGAFTPNEILTAHKAGADVVKVFPSRPLGPAYFRDILAAMPQFKLMPTGGVTLANLREWLSAGAVMVGVATDLFLADAVKRADWKAVEKRAAAFAAVGRTR